MCYSENSDNSNESRASLKLEGRNKNYEISKKVNCLDIFSLTQEQINPKAKIASAS